MASRGSSNLSGAQLWKRGRVWFKAAVLKTVVQKCTVGSNPTVSAIRRDTEEVITAALAKRLCAQSPGGSSPSLSAIYAQVSRAAKAADCKSAT